MARNTLLTVPGALQDRRAFEAEAAKDAFAGVPADRLLAGLRGKDVVFGVVESYGRSALENPKLAATIDPALQVSAAELTRAGFTARSAYLTSSTYGGGSWLAHATFQSGLWIDHQQRYRQLTAGTRLTLTKAFQRAGWHTAAIEPGNTKAWPEADFYGYDEVYDSRNLGYRGPRFGWSRMPDQYALAQFQRTVYARPDRAPLMAEVSLTSSHTPWAPTPVHVDWDAVGDGSVYGPVAAAGKKKADVWKSTGKVRTEYARAVAYSVGSLTSWAATYGDENLVLVFFGDHQASPTISGRDASHDVPITIAAKDPAALDRIAGWGWQDGIRPDSDAPVWRMDSFRDRFLTAFAEPNPSRKH
jgi:Sulfatase